jgi:replicative DNA helicase
MLSDLRESGSIEQDADMVMFIYRPEYYQLAEWEDGEPTNGQAEVIIAKNRHGANDNIRLRFINDFTKFTDLNEDAFSNIGSNQIPDNPGFITISSKLNTDEDTTEFSGQVPF